MADTKKVTPEAKPAVADVKRQQDELDAARFRGLENTPPVAGSLNEPIEPAFHVPEAQAAPEPSQHEHHDRHHQKEKVALPGEVHKPKAAAAVDPDDFEEELDEEDDGDFKPLHSSKKKRK